MIEQLEECTNDAHAESQAESSFPTMRVQEWPSAVAALAMKGEKTSARETWKGLKGSQSPSTRDNSCRRSHFQHELLEVFEQAENGYRLNLMS